MTGRCKKYAVFGLMGGGYRGVNMMEWVTQCFQIVLQTILRSNDKQGVKLLTRHWVVEKTFARLYRYR